MLQLDLVLVAFGFSLSRQHPSQNLSAAKVVEPRFTKDIDVNLRLGPNEVQKFTSAVDAIGAQLRGDAGVHLVTLPSCSKVLLFSQVDRPLP